MRKNVPKLQQSSLINILLLDDEISILEPLKKQIEKQNYNCISTNDCNEAIETIRKSQPAIDILICDYLMIGTTAAEVVKKIREFNSKIYIILLTGFSRNIPPLHAIRTIDIDSYSEKSEDFEDIMLKIEMGVKSIIKSKPLGFSDNGLKFHEKLRLLRLKLDKTQDEIAEQLGVGRTTIVNYEHGRITPPMDNLKKLASIYSVSCDYLME